MVAVGMLFTWLGYSLGLQGWCLWKDYDVTLGQLMSPLHPYNGPWPPAKIPDGQTWPGGTTPAAGAGSGSAAPSGQQQQGQAQPGILGQIGAGVKKGLTGILGGL